MKITVQSSEDQKAYYEQKVKDAAAKQIKNDKKRKQRDENKR
jgi:hypothetical protein